MFGLNILFVVMDVSGLCELNTICPSPVPGARPGGGAGPPGRKHAAHRGTPKPDGTARHGTARHGTAQDRAGQGRAGQDRVG